MESSEAQFWQCKNGDWVISKTTPICFKCTLPEEGQCRPTNSLIRMEENLTSSGRSATCTGCGRTFHNIPFPVIARA